MSLNYNRCYNCVYVNVLHIIVNSIITWQALFFSDSHQFISGESFKLPQRSSFIIDPEIAEFCINFRFVINRKGRGRGGGRGVALGMRPDCVLETIFREVISSRPGHRPG